MGPRNLFLGGKINFDHYNQRANTMINFMMQGKCAC